MKQRKWTAEEKFAIVMEGLKGQKTVSEICREHALSQTVYYKWRDAFLEYFCLAEFGFHLPISFIN